MSERPRAPGSPLRSRRSDVVIISGGVSVGPHDHVKPALAELGVREVFWSVALQPGKPTWFGVLDDERLVFGLPGNPVSAVVTFSLFVLPALRALQGRAEARRLEAEAVLDADVKRNPRREQAIRVVLRRGPGRTTAVPNGAQGSHILTSLLGADALAMIPAGEGIALRRGRAWPSWSSRPELGGLGPAQRVNRAPRAQSHP